MHIIKRIISIIVVSLVGLFVAIYALAAIVDGRAASRAERIIASAAPEAGFVSFASDVTVGVHRSFTAESEAGPFIAWLFRFRPYWTNTLVPAFLRPQEGALDLLISSGSCDVYARALVFVMREAGYEAAQLNLVSRRGGGHSITIIRTMYDQTLLVDPEFALIALHEGRMIGPEELSALVHAGKPATDLWHSLIPRDAAPTILETFDFGEMVFAKQGQPLHMVDTISLLPESFLKIGERNGQPISHAEIVDADLYIHWHYIGSRYDRSWVRIIEFEQDTKVKIYTTEAPNPRFMTTDADRRIEGNKIIYNVSQGDSLVFVDGAAGRDFRRLRSYQDIDAIVFRAL
jgi:hypothetical protein